MIETARLTLRPFAADDFEAVHALILPDAMRRFLAHEPTREASFRRFLAVVGGWQLYGFGTFAIVERARGALVGTGGIFRMKRDLADFDDYPEAGWIIAGNCWGRGYATEAMAAAHGWFDDRFGRQRTGCMISPGNTASERVATRLGYKPLREASYLGEAVMLYARVPNG